MTPQPWTRQPRNQWTGTRPLSDRFWEKVDRSGGLWACWPWMAHRNDRRGGYGMLGDGRSQRWAHRVAWELTHGPIPAGLYVLHACDNPPCVNPAHLRIGTQAENLAEMVAKGRGPKPLDSPFCRNGHPYDEANTYRTAEGLRRCRACGRVATRRYAARRRAVA